MLPDWPGNLDQSGNTAGWCFPLADWDERGRFGRGESEDRSVVWSITNISLMPCVDD